MWYYALNGQQQGPVSLDVLQAMFRSGQLAVDTLVWREGMAEWVPARMVTDVQLVQTEPGDADADVALPPLRALPTEPAPELRACCSQCGRGFSSADLIDYQGQLICPSCKEAYFQRLREGLRPQDGGYEYAGFWIRVAAWLVDGVILFMLQSVVLLPLGLSRTMSGSLGSRAETASAIVSVVITYLVQIIVPLLYQGFFLSRYAATPGKKALGLKVLRPDGSQLSFLRAVCRSLASGLSGMILGIGYLMVAFDDERRALHDHICDTRVVR